MLHVFRRRAPQIYRFYYSAPTLSSAIKIILANTEILVVILCTAWLIRVE